MMHTIDIYFEVVLRKQVEGWVHDVETRCSDLPFDVYFGTRIIREFVKIAEGEIFIFDETILLLENFQK